MQVTKLEKTETKMGNCSTQAIDNARVQSSAVRDSPLAWIFSGFEASIPALLYVWAENSFPCSTGPFGLTLKAAPGCFRRRWPVVGGLVEMLRCVDAGVSEGSYTARVGQSGSSLSIQPRQCGRQAERQHSVHATEAINRLAAGQRGSAGCCLVARRL